MAADKKKIAADCWKKGNDAALQGQFDYAVEMLSQSVKLEPENRLFRETLRGVERRKYKDNKKGASMAALSIKPAQMSIANEKRKENWAAVDQLAEGALKVNPWHAQLNAEMANACSRLGYKECAIFGYRTALASEPDSVPNNTALAYLLEDRGEYNEAIECWKRVYKIQPNNGEARSKITQLAASSMMDRGGYEGAKNVREVMTGYDYNRPVKSKAPADADGPGMSLEADLQRAIRKDPSDVDAYLKLADFYKRENRLAEAAETFEKAVSIKPDPSIREQLEDVQLLMLKQNLDIAKQAAGDNAEDEVARKNSVELANELLSREIEVYSSRVEHYPKNLRLKYELAQRLMRRKNFPEAIKLLQQSTTDMRITVDVLTALGECFLREDNKVVARLQYERAAEKVTHEHHPDLFKKIHYTLGRLCEEAKEREKAEAHYNEVLAVDYDYRDALKRLQALQSGK
ncbi:MAG: tetratricopeptide repeat protein [Planctomycetaceae bacterium]